jgi:hypothetical protein
MKVEFENLGNPNGNSHGEFFPRVKNPELFRDPKNPLRRLYRPEFKRRVFKEKMKTVTLLTAWVTVLAFVLTHQITANAFVF